MNTALSITALIDYIVVGRHWSEVRTEAPSKGSQCLGRTNYFKSILKLASTLNRWGEADATRILAQLAEKQLIDAWRDAALIQGIRLFLLVFDVNLLRLTQAWRSGVL